MKSKLTNKRILITGITGFIGTSLAKELTLLGAKVFGVSRSYQDDSVTKVNIINFKEIDKLIMDKKIEVCFHLAGESLVESGQEDPYDTFKINTEGTLNLLESARIHNIEKLIIASSSHVYGKNKTPYKEYYPPKPSRPYETSKACTDMIAQSYADTFSLPVMIGRFVNIYGPGDLHFGRLIPKTIEAVLTGKNPQMWGGDAVRDYLYIDDAIDAYIKLAEVDNSSVGRNKIFNFGSDTTHSVRQVIDEIIKRSGKIVQIEKIEEKRSLEIKEQYVSSVKAKRLLGWKSKVEFGDGISNSLSWYKDYFNTKK